MTNLKPCPFCGGEAMMNPFGDVSGIVVMCLNCSCMTGRKVTAEEAADAWNRRAIDNIVYCKDCKHQNKYDGDNGNFNYCEHLCHNITDDFFCADGEKEN